MLPNSLGDSRLVFHGVRFDVHAVEVAGHRKEVVVHPGAAVILPLMDDGCVVLIRNERFAVGRTLWELPAGTLERGEDPALCAARELTEETGYTAAKVERLLDYYSSPGICTEHMHAFLATGLSLGERDLDETERIEVEVLPWEKTMRMVQSGTICDAKTIAALLYYEKFRRDKR